ADDAEDRPEHRGARRRGARPDAGTRLLRRSPDGPRAQVPPRQRRRDRHRPPRTGRHGRRPDACRRPDLSHAELRDPAMSATTVDTPITVAVLDAGGGQETAAIIASERALKLVEIAADPDVLCDQLAKHAASVVLVDVRASRPRPSSRSSASPARSE